MGTVRSCPQLVCVGTPCGRFSCPCFLFCTVAVVFYVGITDGFVAQNGFVARLGFVLSWGFLFFCFVLWRLLSSFQVSLLVCVYIFRILIIYFTYGFLFFISDGRLYRIFWREIYLLFLFCFLVFSPPPDYLFEKLVVAVTACAQVLSLYALCRGWCITLFFPQIASLIGGDWGRKRGGWEESWSHVYHTTPPLSFPSSKKKTAR